MSWVANYKKFDSLHRPRVIEKQIEKVFATKEAAEQQCRAWRRQYKVGFVGVYWANEI